ncbi:hypothetical protein GCM10009654_32640 [Streptomyces hebeiensis]|uniref:Endonuclease/exonuclease/phosphatase domain-containing protein n=1 Tax=Streptomyces hebeiensis TaxID=229486 RepID=A0ABN1UYF3_9ACTN
MIGSWQQFVVESRESDGPMRIALKSVVDNKYVSVERNAQGDDKDMLRARSDSVGSWERFTLVPLGQVGNGGDRTAPAAAPASDLNIMTWNVRANNNTNCWDGNRAGKDRVSAEIAGRLPRPGTGDMPDVVLLQEFCEKHAKPVEQALEGRTGRQWDVRFAPIEYNLGELGEPVLGQYGVRAQKQCATADGLDRGAYGVALALPDSNTYYQSFPLSSPASFVRDGKTTKAEQRTALCADLPSQALHVCAAHFSAGEGYEDPKGTARSKQAGELLDIAAAAPTGYRPVFGGDLNAVGPDSTGPDGGNRGILANAYASYRECAQLNDLSNPRTGPATAVAAKETGAATMKIDHIFAPRNAPFESCAVSATHAPSDHWSLHGTIHLPAN